MDTYKSTNTLNGKFYIGSTTDFERRKKSHMSSKENYPFQNALRKNPEAFEWEVWSDDSDEPVLEQALLDMFYGTEQCYNLNPSAKHPPRVTPEDNKTRGFGVRDKKLGFHNPEYRESEEYKKMQAEVGNRAVVNKTGVHSPEYRNSEKAKLVSSKNGRSTGKPVRCVETGEVYYSASEASRQIGHKCLNKVASCCSGTRKTAGGYHWEWYQEQ